MTKKNLQLNLWGVMLIYAIFIILGTIIFWCDPHENAKYSAIFKNLILLCIAIPAAWLGNCFQRRASFVAALRQLWERIIPAVNAARQYTRDPNVDQAKFAKVLGDLSHCIDEVRGVYSNIGETRKEVGIYPFESLKAIRYAITKLGFASPDAAKAAYARYFIDRQWDEFKASFLFEFDRPKPTAINSPFLSEFQPNCWASTETIESKYLGIRARSAQPTPPEQLRQNFFPFPPDH